MQAQRKFGAPAKRDPSPGERFQLGVRVTPELKRKLDAAAELSGRSQSQEAEIRLEHSFDRQELLSDVLNIAYGNKKIAGLVRTLGAVFLVAGRVVAGDRNIVDWTSDPAICDVAIEAAHTVLESFRPGGAILADAANAGLGVQVANTFIKSNRHGPGNPAMEQMREVSRSALQTQFERIAERFERIAERLKAPGPKQPAPFTRPMMEAVAEAAQAEMQQRRA